MKRMLIISSVIFFLAATILSFRNLIPERENPLAMLVSDEKSAEYPQTPGGVIHFHKTPQLSPLIQMGLFESFCSNVDPVRLRTGEDFEKVSLIRIRFGKMLPKDARFSIGDLRCFPNLEELWIADARLKDLESISELTRLKRLTLTDCGLEQVQPLASLENLEELNLSHNGIADAAQLSGLKKLRRLNLSYNNTIDSLNGLTEMDALTELNLNNTRVCDLRSLAEMKNLRVLKIDSCLRRPVGGQRHFVGLEELVQLEELYMSSNGLSSVEDLSGLHRLRKLDLYGCAIADPENLAALTALEELNIGACGVTSLEWVTNLTKLERLDLSGVQNGAKVISFGPIADLKLLKVMIIDQSDVGKLKEIVGRTNVKIIHTGMFFAEPVSIEEALSDSLNQKRW